MSTNCYTTLCSKHSLMDHLQLVVSSDQELQNAKTVPNNMNTVKIHVSSLVRELAENTPECRCSLLNELLELLVKHPALVSNTTTLPLILETLAKGNECCKYMAASVLATMTADYGRRANVAKNPDAIPGLVKCLRCMSPQSSRPVCVALGNLALEPGTHDDIVYSGTLSLLTELLVWKPEKDETVTSEVSSECKHHAAYVLLGLAKSQDTIKKLAQPAMIKAVVDLIATSIVVGDAADPCIHIACEVLKRLASSQRCQRLIVDSGGVSTLVQVLHGRRSCPPCTRAAVYALLELHRWDDSIRSLTADCQVVEVLFDYLTGSDPFATHYAIKLLADLAQTPEVSDMVVEADGLQHLITMAASMNIHDDAKIAAITTLAFLARSSKVQLMLANAKVLSPAVRLLRHQDIKVQVMMLRLLANMSCSKAGLSLFTEENVLDMLLLYVAHGSEDRPFLGCAAKLAALRAICNVSLHSVVQHQLAGSTAAVECLLELVQHHDPRYALLALKTVAHVIHLDKVQHIVMNESMGVEVITHMLGAHDRGCRFYSAYILSLLSRNPAAHGRLLGGHALQLCGALLRDTNDRMRSTALELVVNLVGGPKNNSTRLLGVPQLIIELGRLVEHQDKKCMITVLQLLSEVSTNYDVAMSITCCGVVRVLLPLLDNTTPRDTKRMVLLVLMRCCQHPKRKDRLADRVTLHDRLRDAKLVTALARCLQNENDVLCRRYCLVALFHLCLEDDQCQIEFIQRGGGYSLIIMVESSDLLTQKCAAGFTRALAYRSLQRQQLLCSSGITGALCRAIERSQPNSEVQTQLAIGLLEVCGRQKCDNLSLPRHILRILDKHAPRLTEISFFDILQLPVTLGLASADKDLDECDSTTLYHQPQDVHKVASVKQPHRWDSVSSSISTQ